jgi:hypothetical protein
MVILQVELDVGGRAIPRVGGRVENDASDVRSRRQQNATVMACSARAHAPGGAVEFRVDDHPDGATCFLPTSNGRTNLSPRRHGLSPNNLTLKMRLVTAAGRPPRDGPSTRLTRPFVRTGDRNDDPEHGSPISEVTACLEDACPRWKYELEVRRIAEC